MASFDSTPRLLDKFITKHTSRIGEQIKGSLRDTAHHLKELPDEVSPDATVFAADVLALYPSIPWEEGIKAATDFYASKLGYLRAVARRNKECMPPSRWLFEDILKLVITRNHFSFKNRRWFHQRRGTAMGASISVFFANAYMYSVTRELVDEETRPADLILFVRFIDDLLFIIAPSLLSSRRRASLARENDDGEAAAVDG